MTGRSSKAAIVLCVWSFYNVPGHNIMCDQSPEVSLWDRQPLHLRMWSYGFENTFHAKKRKSCLSSCTKAIFVEVISFSYINTFHRFPLLESFFHKKSFHIHSLFVYFPFLREKDCNWCFHEYLPVSDSSEVRWKPAYQWGRRDYKVKTPVQVT